MNDKTAELLPPTQEILACNAMLGDPPSQRTVLELAVRLSDAGIEPIEIFKRAVLFSLRRALESGKLPPRRDAKRKGTAGEEFQLAVAWWKAKLAGSKKPSSVVAAEIDPSGKRNLLPAINRARKRHGDLSDLPDLAKERALFELAFGPETGPNGRWFGEWQKCRQDC